MIGIIKGDKRLTYLHEMLNDSILSSNEDDFYDIDILVLGFSGIDINHFILGTGINLDRIIENNNIRYVVTGTTNSELALLAKKHRFEVIELLKDEEFIRDNAFLTAIGIIYYLQQSDLDLSSKKFLVLGYGNISYYIINLFKAYRVNYKIYPMNEFEEKILRLNNELLANSLYDNADIIINTVPKNHTCDYNLLTGTHIVDIASYPYGFDKSMIKAFNIDYKILSGIPAIYTPKSAAKLIKKAINSIV